MSGHGRAAKQAGATPAARGGNGTARRKAQQAPTPRADSVTEVAVAAPGSEPREALLDQEIATIAYAMWVAKGRPDGTDRADWFDAEQRLRDRAADCPA